MVYLVSKAKATKGRLTNTMPSYKPNFVFHILYTDSLAGQQIPCQTSTKPFVDLGYRTLEIKIQTD
jgi:hypothetical protein